MQPTDPVAAYLRTLRDHLDVPDPERVVDEIAAHIDDDIAAEMAAGRDRSTSTSIVLARMGPAQDLARRYRAPSTFGATLVVAAIGTAFTVAWLAYVTITVLPRRDPAGIPFWTGVTVALAVYLALIIVLGVGRDSRVVRAVASIASFVAIGIGASWIVQMLARTDDFEGYVVLLGAVLVFDGAVVLIRTMTRSRPGRRVAR